MDNPFVWGSGGQQETPDQNRMAIAQALLQQGQQPANNIAQGAANAINSFAGGYLQQQARNQATQGGQSDPFAGAGTDANNPQTRPDNQSSALLSPASQIGGFLSGLFHPDPFAGAGTAPSGTTGSGW